MKTRLLFATWAGLSLLALSANAEITISTVLSSGLAEPWGVAMDGDDNIYVSDSVHNRIVRVDASTQAATTLAGLPSEPAGSYDGFPYEARFNRPEGLIVVSGITNTAVHAILGTSEGLVVADSGNHLIRFVRLNDGVVMTLAGNTNAGAAIDGSGVNARFRYPAGLADDGAGHVYIVDWGNNKIRVLDMNDPTFAVATLAISGSSSHTNLNRPVAVAFGATNSTGTSQLWIADTGNQMIKLVALSATTAGTLTSCLGGYKTTGATDSNLGANARFNGPCGLAWTGKALLVCDTLNNVIRMATNYPAFGATNYAVTTFVGTGEAGLVDGGATSAKLNSPYAIVRDQVNTGFLFADLKNNALRRIQSGPALTAVPNPRVGWVEFVDDGSGAFIAILRTNQPAIFNNDVPICVDGTQGTQTHFTVGPTPEDVLDDTIPNPSSTVGNTPPEYWDGMYRSQVPLNTVTIQPDFTVKAVGYQEGRKMSDIVSARFQFETGTPSIQGLNAASFKVTDVTSGAKIYYATNAHHSEDLKIQPNDPRLTWKGPYYTPTNLSLVIVSNTDYYMYATRDSYATSAVSSQTFWVSNYVANKIVFGFEDGQAASDFAASPGQRFFAPVTLTILPGTRIYSLQFNITATNAGPNPGPTIRADSAAFGFGSCLWAPVKSNPSRYYAIPPAMFLGWVTNWVVVTNITVVDGTNRFEVETVPVATGPVDPPPGTVTNSLFGTPILDLTFVDAALNLIGVGWLERKGEVNLYDTTAQDLIKYSSPHDTLFHEDGGRVVVGAYSFRVPTNAAPGQTYQIRLGRPSATSDGVGTPGADVYIETPTNGGFGSGTLGSLKTVVIAQKKYIVGDAAPFRWMNAGEFGNTNLDNSDLMQVFQSAIYSLNYPEFGSDFFDCLDSCGGFGVNRGHGFLEFGGYMNTDELNNMFDGNDSDINSIAFGDGILDACDVYVTFRRSLDPSLYWFRRFWTNGVRAAEVVFPQGSSGLSPARGHSGKSLSSEIPTVSFVAGDVVGSPGQLVQVPITAQVFTGYPLRVVMLNASLNPLDQSPAPDTAVQFTPSGPLGTPTLVSSKTTSYGATWLNSAAAGLTGSNLVGYLTLRIPTNATSTSAYAICFEHASGSPNGLASFATRKWTGLVTVGTRSGSTYNDNIPDSWRLRFFGTVNNLLSQADADADGDGVNNWQEYLTATDPTDSKSHLKLSASSSVLGKGIRWPTVAGKRYVLERALSLYGTGWIPVSTNIGSGADLEFVDPSGSNAGFYRVRLAP